MEEKKGNAGWLVLGLFLPIVGICLYFAWAKDRPADARMAIVGVFIGIAISVIIGVVGYIGFSLLKAWG